MFTQAIFAGLATVLISVSPALAGSTCPEVYIEAVNNTGDVIKIIDLDYAISGHGVTSDTIRNSDRQPGQIYSTERNLPHAMARNTQVVVKYRLRAGGAYFDKWSGIRTARSAYQECGPGTNYRISIE